MTWLYVCAVIAYLIAGLFISRWWYRRLTWVTDEEQLGAVLMVFCWPVWCVCWPIGKFVKWFYK